MSRPARHSHVSIGMLLYCLTGLGCGDESSGPQSQVAVAGASTVAGAPAPAAGAGRIAEAGAGPVSGRVATAGSSAPPAGAAGPAAVGGSAGRSEAGASGAAPSVAGRGGSQPTAGSSAAGAPSVGGMGGTPGATGASGAAAPGTPCEKGAIKASEVVFIGESFIAATNAIPRMTTQLARDAGKIGMNESYRTFAVSGTQLTTGDIPNQYARAKAERPLKVILMDGGGNDLLIGNRCKGSFDASCKAVVDVVAKLFGTFKADGVKDVVYFFYPDPMGIGAQIKAAMDILRPEMKKLCDDTPDVRCIWVDQRESWQGNYERFTSDGIHPTDAGSMASAKQIWDAMVANCIAQ